MNNRLQTIILLSQFLIILALEMTNPFLPLLIASQANMSLPSTVMYTTLALALPMVANIIMTPLWGLLADRWGYKTMLMRAVWALVFTQGFMIIADSTSWIMTIRILQGGFAGFIVAMQTYALTLCNWQKKSRQLARLQSTKAIATTVAGLTGGLLLTLFSYRGLYTTAMLVCLVTALVMQKKLPPSPGAPSLSPSNKRLKSAWSLNLFILVISLLIFLTQVAKFVIDPVFSLVLKELLQANMVTIGLLYSLPAAGMLLASEWCGRRFDRCRTNPVSIQKYLTVFSLLGMLTMAAQAASTNLILLSLSRALWGVSLAALLPAFFALVSDHYERQGYALGLANSFAKLGNLTGILLGGWLGGWLPFQQLLLVVAAIYGFIAMICYGYYSLIIKGKCPFPVNNLEQSHE